MSLDIANEVKKDIDATVKLAYLTGSKVKVHSGRDFLRDAYEDSLQTTLKLKAALLERDGAG